MVRRLQRFDFVVTLGCLALLSYFAWHAFKGPRGYAHLEALKAKQAALAVELQSQQQAKMSLESRVALLRPESVDPDLLEELARTELELSRRNELIVRLAN